MKNLSLIISAISLLVLSAAPSLHAEISSRADDDDKILLPAYLVEQEISFEFYSNRSSYHCDFIRAETIAMLRHLGATDIDVECEGGLPYRGRNEITARFISVRQTTNDKSTRMATMTPVMFNFSTSCDLHDVLVQNILTGFDTFDYVAEGSCRGSRGALSYQFKTLF